MAKEINVSDPPKKEKRYVGIKETVLYGIANGGQVMGYNLVRMQLTFFFVTVFGIPAEAVTLMVFITGIWDTLNDPIMGGIVDRTRTRYGKLRPFLIFVPIPLAITTVMLFGGAEFLSGVESTGAKIAYMYVSYILWEFFYTIGDIPFWGLSAAISPSPADRSQAISSARFISNIIGGIVNMMIPVFIDLTTRKIIPWNMKQVFLFMGLLAGVVGCSLFSLSGLCTRERVVQTNDEPSILACFKYLVKNKPLLLIVISNVLSTVAGIGEIFKQYFYTFSLGVASLSIVVGIPGTIMGFLAYLAIPKLEKRFSSKQIIIMNSFITAITSAIVFLLGSGSYTNKKVIAPLLAVSGIITSFISSVNMVVPTKMIGDTVDYMEWKTGERNEGMSFSILTFMSKLTGSFGTGIATLIMPFIGLESINDQMQLIDTGVNTRFWLWALITVIPSVLGLISLIPYKFYDLEGEKLKKIHEEMRVHRLERMKEVSYSDIQSETEEENNG